MGFAVYPSGIGLSSDVLGLHDELVATVKVPVGPAASCWASVCRVYPLPPSIPQSTRVFVEIIQCSADIHSAMDVFLDDAEKYFPKLSCPSMCVPADRTTTLVLCVSILRSCARRRCVLRARGRGRHASWNSRRSPK